MYLAPPGVQHAAAADGHDPVAPQHEPGAGTPMRGWALSRLWHHRRAQAPPVNPVLVEEEAADRLYGFRTGTVNASPATPPAGVDVP